METLSTPDLIAHFRRDAAHWATMLARARLQPVTASATDVARWRYYQVASETAAQKLTQLRDLEQAA